LDTNTIFGIVGVVLAIVSLIASFYFYKKSIRIKEPVYSIKSVNVISDYASTYNNLTVSYKNEKVENFTVSKVLFFNEGEVTIDREDIAPLNQLRIVAKTGSILDTTVLQVNNPSSDFKVSLDRANGLVMIDFDYLNQHQGAVIEVIHTGLSSKDIDVVGDMKEVKSLIRISPGFLNTSSPSIVKSVKGVTAKRIWLDFLLILLITLLLRNLRNAGFLPSLNNDLTFFLVVLASVMSILLLVDLSINAIGKSTAIPKGLEKFEE